MPKEGVSSQEHEVRASDLELSDSFVPKSAARLKVELVRRDKNVLARGRVKALTSLRCGRCLHVFEREVEADFLVEFEPLESFQRRQADLPGDEPADHFASYTGDNLPLGEELRQELELAVPTQPVCSPACKGLCPHCGANLNKRTCSCKDQQANHPFESLKNLLKES